MNLDYLDYFLGLPDLFRVFFMFFLVSLIFFIVLFLNKQKESKFFGIFSFILFLISSYYLSSNFKEIKTDDYKDLAYIEYSLNYNLKRFEQFDKEKEEIFYNYLNPKSGNFIHYTYVFIHKKVYFPLSKENINLSLTLLNDLKTNKKISYFNFYKFVYNINSLYEIDYENFNQDYFNYTKNNFLRK